MNKLQQNSRHGAPSNREEEARHWLLRLNLGDDEGTVSEAEWREFAEWRDASPDNAQAYSNAEMLWGDLKQWQGLAELEPLDKLSWREKLQLARARAGEKRIGFRLQWLVPVAALLLIAVSLTFYLPENTANKITALNYATTVAESREVELPDSSHVILGAKTTIEVQFTNGLRQVSLLDGEAFFDVQADPSRPFVVVNNNRFARVLGTRFNVRGNARSFAVAVEQGRVKVAQTTGRADFTAPVMVREDSERLVGVGEQVLINGINPPGAVQSITPGNIGAWRNGRLSYFDASLSNVIDDANRYYQGNIVIAEKTLADLRVTAAFRTDEIDALINNLEASLPLRAQRRGNGDIYLVGKGRTSKP